MNFTLTDEQEQLRKTVIRFAEDELNAGARERDQQQVFDRDLWQKCGELKLQGLPVDEAYGGRGVDPLTTAIGLEALGYGCHDSGLAFAVCAHLLACVIPVWKHGSEEQKQRFLPGLCDGTLIAANGMSEPKSGSDPFSMATRAEPDGDGFRLNGTKTFISNGPVADVAVIYAMTDPEKGYHGGVTAFLVERGTPGFQASERFDKMSLRTCQMSELVLDDVYLPAEAILGQVGGGAFLFTQSMEWERICLVANHVGKMERLLERAVKQARTRTAFGQKVGKFQAVSHRIVDMKVRLEAARLLTYKAASRLGKARDIAMDASITKLFVSESLVTSAMDAVRVFGGYGVLTEYDVERDLRDAIASTIYSGTNDMQRNIVAGWLGL
jgi:alkylation response protein AidB-like acyl-CoA dehydrogenase